ncbi:MAG: hypothetical protein RBR22_05530 [Desulfuromonas sp.]|nr:hypothetical protein [Desulfuromonas sp.]
MTDHELLLSQLSEEKRQLIDKFNLTPKQIDGKIYWVRSFNNRPDHPYATHRAFRRCHIVELVFSFYDLCVAKMTYFRQHIHDYIPCKRDYRNGELIPCELWDMEFLQQQNSNVALDLRNLAEINDIDVFRELCQWLEAQQTTPLHLVRRVNQ